MANEITVQPKLQIVNGFARIDLSPGALRFDQASAIFYHAIHKIGTAEESITSFGDVTTEGWCYLRNLDVENYVQWGFATAVYGGRMEAREVAMFRLDQGADLYLKANTAECAVEVFVAQI